MLQTIDNARVEEFAWGRIEWLASGALGNCHTMTLGRVTIFAGGANARHVHPNCDELLHLLSGELEHFIGNTAYSMRAGDTISIATGEPHFARVTGGEAAIMLVSYSSSHRETLFE